MSIGLEKHLARRNFSARATAILNVSAEKKHIEMVINNTFEKNKN